MMRFIALTVILLFSALSGISQTEDINIIPKPNSIVRGAGSFLLDKQTKIAVTGKADRKLADVLNDHLAREYGFRLKVVRKNFALLRAAGVITISDTGNDVIFPDDGYSLSVESSRISLTGTTEAARFYAIQTLIQMMPAKAAGTISIPEVEIRDSSRFRYRGMHLDTARHFMPVEFVKKYIDLMSQYKFNYFHWHLTDDQGWRIEIKKYPRLTEIGSVRPETMVGRNFSPFVGDATPHGGYYTQKQIKEVVDYANARFVTIIPEIELPGHASAALAAYPEFGCKADHQYKVATTWGIFKEVYCPTDATFKFLENVLAETIKLFPDSPYIHIGGDEVLKDHWKESEFVQKLKERENLKDEHEVQSYFIRRIEKFINSKGKNIIGWDEILEGGLAPNATVMSWRGMRGGIEAAKSHHNVIMTPTDFAYFDYGQGDPEFEPLNIGSYVPLEKVYGFEPIPPELTADEAQYVIGGQANVWTEYMKTSQQVEYMAFPRMLALAEVLWSRKENRDFADFQTRFAAHLPRLDRQQVNYRIPEPAGLRNIVSETGRSAIELFFAPGTRVFYTTDGSRPDVDSPLYQWPIVLDLAEGEIKTLKTIVVNPDGRKSSVYSATIVRGKWRTPERTDGVQPGVAYEFFIPRGDLSGEGEKTTGETRSIRLNQFAERFDLKAPFAVTFDAYFRAPADGVYQFQVDAAWDTTVVLGTEMIINDAGTEARKIRSAIVPLKAGLHKISLRYNHRGGDPVFRFLWGIKGQPLRQALGSEFVH